MMVDFVDTEIREPFQSGGQSSGTKHIWGAAFQIVRHQRRLGLTGRIASRASLAPWTQVDAGRHIKRSGTYRTE